MGPLQQRAAMKQLIGFSAGHFQTTGTEQWPSEMCKWIAGEILGSFLQKTSQKETTNVTATEGAGDKLDNAAFPVSKPEGRKLVGGMGEPRFCHTPEKSRAFHDGAGLASMGRCDVEKRIWSQNNFWKILREKTVQLVIEHLPPGTNLDRTCFEMAVKGEAGCSLVKTRSSSRACVNCG